MGKRVLKLDIIRIFALFCVICVHFLLNSGFYDTEVSGIKMYCLILSRSLFIICVPLFLILTGYLMNRKTISKKYYRGISRTLIVYIICSIIYSIFLKFYLKEEMTIKIFIERLLNFTGTEYAWYIEMYIGLFLLIPFLNIIFNNLSKKENQILLFTLVLVVALPSVLNIFKFDSIDWWKMPSSDKKYVKILPDWWSKIYPILYYFLGAYLYKYNVKLSIRKNIILLVVVMFLDGTFNYYRSYKTNFIWGAWNTYSSLSVFIMTFLVFNILSKIKINKSSNKIELILKVLSEATLGAYLISCMFDEIVYTKLIERVPNVFDRFYYAPIVVLIVFLSSMITSICIDILYKLICIVINKLKNILQREGKVI